MPTSDYLKISTLVELIVLTNPRRLLDIGIGFGKYGVLAREYLELWGATASYDSWQRRIDGVEIHKEYLTPLHDYIYDTIYVGDADDILGTLTEAYDLALLIDILEHVSYDQGHSLLVRCQQISRNLIICTPKEIGDQGEVFGNPHEAHVSQWKREHFEGLKNHFFVPDPTSIICFVGTDAQRVWRWRINSRLAQERRRESDS
jgi:cyclopropane fatty-acyl-phospholipid synthase-like methyltransferase